MNQPSPSTDNRQASGAFEKIATLNTSRAIDTDLVTAPVATVDNICINCGRQIDDFMTRCGRWDCDEVASKNSMSPTIR